MCDSSDGWSPRCRVRNFNLTISPYLSQVPELWHLTEIEPHRQVDGKTIFCGFCSTGCQADGWILNLYILAFLHSNPTAHLNAQAGIVLYMSDLRTCSLCDFYIQQGKEDQKTAFNHVFVFILIIINMCLHLPSARSFSSSDSM